MGFLHDWEANLEKPHSHGKASGASNSGIRGGDSETPKESPGGWGGEQSRSHKVFGTEQYSLGAKAAVRSAGHEMVPDSENPGFKSPRGGGVVYSGSDAFVYPALGGGKSFGRWASSINGSGEVTPGNAEAQIQVLREKMKRVRIQVSRGRDG